MINPRRALKAFIFLLIAGAVIGYAYFALHAYLRGPQIIVWSPQNGATMEQSYTVIEGMARGIAYFYLDDRQIFTDEAGYFKESLLLYPGYNIIVLSAKDRFGRTTENRLQLMLKEK